MNQDFDFKKNYDMLNDAQKKVVEEMYGPIMVVAGPGTGKTQIIGMRTANMIQSWIAAPENILITTFTEAWVIAIKKRLSQFIGTEAYKIKITTIHSFAQDVISTFPEKFADCKASETIDEIESYSVLQKILEEYIADSSLKYLFNAHDRMMYLRDIKDRIGKLKWEWVSPEKFEYIIAEQRTVYDEKLEALKDNKRIRDLKKRTAKDTEAYKKHIGKLTELNTVYKEYAKYLHENSLYDFSDMINFVVEKMRTDEDLTAYYAEKYQFIMIDEYQDTNNPQNEIMDMILKVWEQKNIMVVGDDDQSIYRFQGANIENMLDFYTKYPETQFIVLQDNYRSAQSVLDLSTKLIENNSERLVNRLDFLEKTLEAQSEYKNNNENSYTILADDMSEKSYVLENIKALQKKDDGENYAIIVRSNREVREWTDFFQTSGIEVESKLKTNILENKYVQFLLNYMEIVIDPYSCDTKLMDIMRSELIDVENIDIITLSRELYRKNYSKQWFKLCLWDVLQNLDIDYAEQYREEEEEYNFETRQENKFRDYKKLLAFRDSLIASNASAKTGSWGILVSQIIEQLWVLQHVESIWVFSDLEDIYTFFNKIKAIQVQTPDILLKDILEKFRLHKKYNIIISRDILRKTEANIEILTAHSSKWLEYNYVFIPWMYGWNWESKRMIDKLKLPLGMTGEWLQFAWLDEKQQKNLEKEMTLQEDRRLFFVAITRAKKVIYFSRPAGKGNKPYIESPFLLELWIDWKVQTKKLSEELLTESIYNDILGEKFIQTSDEELEYISQFLENYRLSPTDLNTFLEDPMTFLENVIFKYPFTGNEFTIFWNIYHKVLEESINKQFRGETVELWFMTEKFTQLLEKQLLTAEEKPRLLKKWIDGLTGYHEQFSNNPRTPLQVEYNFRPRNIVFEWIPITGKVDKIEKIGDAITQQTSSQPSPLEEKEQQLWLFTTNVALVDYKTGSSKTIWAIKWEDRYGNKKDDWSQGKYYRQLLFYKLLAENDSEFMSEYTIWELALDFVEGKDGKYSYMPVEIDEQDFTEFQDLVKDSWEKIHSLDFWKEVLGK
jgi:DNA helicase II / ATP-dependent DNA helicase PcrA